MSGTDSLRSAKLSLNTTIRYTCGQKCKCCHTSSYWLVPQPTVQSDRFCFQYHDVCLAGFFSWDDQKCVTRFFNIFFECAEQLLGHPSTVGKFGKTGLQHNHDSRRHYSIFHYILKVGLWSLLANVICINILFCMTASSLILILSCVYVSHHFCLLLGA